MIVRIIRTSDIARCPAHSLLPSHYRDDGTCLHVPVPELTAEVLAAAVEAKNPEAARRLRGANRTRQQEQSDVPGTMPDSEREYRVTWDIDITADSPLDAARRAREIQLNPKSWATVFTVDGEYIDLDDTEDDQNPDIT